MRRRFPHPSGPRGRVTAALGIAVVLAGLGTALAPAASAQPAQPTRQQAPLAATPPMGWNDWAHYQCDIDENLILSQAQALVSTGLAAKGYNTVTTDDCWPAAKRDANGNLVADPVKFPDGMAYVGRRIHQLGLKFGIYEDAGTSTCGGYPGSWNHWQADADTFASWGVDYLKLDGCNLPSVPGQTDVQTFRYAYSSMSAALAKSGRRIVFSESAPAYFQGTPDWYTVLGWIGRYGQLWREGYDIQTYDSSNPNASRWNSVLTNYGYNNPIHRYAHPGNWNDADFIIGGDSGLTLDESRSQVALWAEMAAPMILSSDVAKLSPQALAIVGNKDVIAVDQDPLGSPGYVVAQNGSLDVLTRALANGDRSVALLNRSNASATETTTTAQAGFTGGAGCRYTVKDLWTGRTSTTAGTISATVPAHGTAIFRVMPAPGCGSTTVVGQITGVAKNGIGGKCIDDSNSSTADGNPVIIYSCTGNPNQQWTPEQDGTVRTLGKCLTAQGSTSDSPVVLSSCSGSATQRWHYATNGNLVNGASGLCLDATGGSAADGTKLITYTCGDNQDNQIWSLPG